MTPLAATLTWCLWHARPPASQIGTAQSMTGYTLPAGSAKPACACAQPPADAVARPLNTHAWVPKRSASRPNETFQ